MTILSDQLDKLRHNRYSLSVLCVSLLFASLYSFATRNGTKPAAVPASSSSAAAVFVFVVVFVLLVPLFLYRLVRRFSSSNSSSSSSSFLAGLDYKKLLPLSPSFTAFTFSLLLSLLSTLSRCSLSLSSFPPSVSVPSILVYTSVPSFLVPLFLHLLYLRFLVPSFTSFVKAEFIKELTKTANGRKVTVGEVYLSLMDGLFEATDIVCHTPERDKWGWESPLIARCGHMRVRFSALSFLPFGQKVLFKYPCKDVYSVVVSDIQVRELITGRTELKD